MNTNETAVTFTARYDGAETAYVNGKRVGVVRRARALETVNMAGRSWVAIHGGKRLPGTFPTRKAAVEALIAR